MTVYRRFTLLGTGSSGGVPRVGNQWGDCNPAQPKNRRRRCALLVEQSDSASFETRTRVLIDAGADLREQLLSADVDSLDAVLLTHAHADHIFGLDDLRQLALYLRRSIDVYLDEPTREVVMRSFGYCFHQAEGSSYPAFCTEHRMTHPGQVTIAGAGGELTFQTLLAEHGDIDALGFRIGPIAYLPDVKRVADDTSLSRLQELDVLILDALRYRSHPSHLSVDEALALVEDCKPRRTVLTNMHSDLDYDQLRRTLPGGIEPAYDGLRIDWEREP